VTRNRACWLKPLPHVRHLSIPSVRAHKEARIGLVLPKNVLKPAGRRAAPKTTPGTLLEQTIAFIHRGIIGPGVQRPQAKDAPADARRPRIFLMANRRPLAHRTASELCCEPKHLAGRTCHDSGRTINSLVLFPIDRPVSSRESNGSGQNVPAVAVAWEMRHGGGCAPEGTPRGRAGPGRGEGGTPGVFDGVAMAACTPATAWAGAQGMPPSRPRPSQSLRACHPRDHALRRAPRAVPPRQRLRACWGAVAASGVAGATTAAAAPPVHRGRGAGLFVTTGGIVALCTKSHARPADNR
jgi:hypothetical protein